MSWSRVASFSRVVRPTCAPTTGFGAPISACEVIMRTPDRDISLELPLLSKRRLDLLLERRVRENPDKEYLAFPEENLTLSFAEIASAARSYGGFLRGTGLEVGD